MVSADKTEFEVNLVPSLQSEIIEAGKNKKLCVIIDFDHTISRYVNPDGTPGPSSHQLLKEFLKDEEREASAKVDQYYYGIEQSIDITIEEKIPKMIEWYQKTNNFFLGVVTKEMIKQGARDSPLMIREGCKEFFQLCNEREIPIIIFSAGVRDVIEILLQREMPDAKYTLIANELVFDENGFVADTGAHILHPYNKFLEGTHAEIVKDQTHVLLVGDNEGDSQMASKLPHLTPYSFVFLNKEARRPNMEKLFSVVSTDTTFQSLNDVIHSM